jgi:cytochrome c oxidase cbb3-type subunit 2
MKANAARAALVVAGIYGYFLIFAQFAFVELLRSGGAGLTGEKMALGAMAVAGIAGGFFAAWRGAGSGMVRIALGIAAVSSALAPMLKSMPGALGIAIATGGGLGVATVSLASLIPAWCGVRWLGLGTGLAYACCNLPAVFQQTPAGQSVIASVFATVGLLAVPSASGWNHEPKRMFPMWGAVAVFTALVWLDSAAFFIIQHAGDLKSGTWGENLLWRNAAIHLTIAIAAGFWLASGRARILPAFAWAVLAAAALAVNTGSTRHLAGLLYPAAVSLYSAALVAWPGWFCGAENSRQAGWRAAWLFAIAGWFGSANGIGMAQSLQRVPPVFVAISGIVVAVVMIASQRKHWRAAVAVAAVILLAVSSTTETPPSAGTAAARGHQIYLSEGCIHCHSQYVRPGSADEAIWGPASKLGEVLAEKPVLIGNRRQGPDLTNVGARRSERWLKLHFIDPRQFVPGSPMPSYAHLFESGDGDDLVSYLSQSGIDGIGKVLETAAEWRPQGVAGEMDGKLLFANNCAACHGSNGYGDGTVSLHLPRKPANLVNGPFAWTPEGDGLDLRVARVIKFGLPGTDMPGHEVLTGAEVLALKDWILKLR